MYCLRIALSSDSGFWRQWQGTENSVAVGAAWWRRPLRLVAATAFAWGSFGMPEGASLLYLATAYNLSSILTYLVVLTTQAGYMSTMYQSPRVHVVLCALPVKWLEV